MNRPNRPGSTPRVPRGPMVILLMTCCLLPASFGWPTKPEKNLAVCRAVSHQEDVLVVSDGAQGAIMAWTDSRAGNKDIYAQRVDANGGVLWQADGVAVRDTPQDQQLLDLVTDGSGGAVVIWAHDTGAGGDDLYVQRLDGSGTPQWTMGGVVVEDYREVWGAQAVSDGTGGALIVMWDAWVEGFFWVKRVAGNGQLPWAGAVDPAVSGMGNTGAKITSHGAGGAILAWRVHPAGTPPDTDSNLVAQRIDALGNEVWPAPVAVCATTHPILSYAIVSDDTGGAFLFFADGRSPTTGIDLYGQKINAAGTTLWTVNGTVISAYNGAQERPTAILDSSGGAIVMWDDYRAGSLGERYLQKVDPFGNGVWTAHGVDLCPGLDDPFDHDLASDGAGGCIGVYAVDQGGTADLDLFATRIDATGAARWGVSGVELSTATSLQGSPQVVDDGWGGVVVAWTDYREFATRGMDVYAQRVVKNGDLGPSVPPQPDVLGHHPWKTATAGDPISMGQGVLRESWPLLQLGGPIPVDISLIYAPDLRQKAVPTDGRWSFPPQETILAFTHSAMLRLVEIQDLRTQPLTTYLNVLFGDDLVVFQSDGLGGYQAMGSLPYQIHMDGETTIVMDPITQWTFFFPTRDVEWEWGESFVVRCGEVSEIVDRNGNTVSFSYNADRLPISIQDAFGRALTLSYLDAPQREDRHLSEITDDAGRTVSFSYTTLPAVGGRTERVLSAFTNAEDEVVQFAYFDTENNDASLLTGIVQPMTNAHADQVWWAPAGKMPWVAEQADAYNHVAGFEVVQETADTTRVACTQPDLTTRIFRHKKGRFPLEITDELGASTTLSYEEADQLSQIQDREDGVITMTFHGPSGRVADVTNPEGHSYSFGYTARDQTISNAAATRQATFTFYDLTRVDFPDGSFETATRDGQGNLATWSDRNDQTWGFAPNAQGFLQQVSNPWDGQTTFTFHSDGTLASSTDTDAGVTSFTSDPGHRLARITHPDGTFLEWTYDAANRVTAFADEREFTLTYDYDDNGNLIVATDPFFQSDAYAYDLMDRLQSVTNRSGGVTSYEYDTRGWLAERTFEGWASLAFLYDAAGHVTQIFDPILRPWTVTPNAEGLPMSVTTPMGRTTTIHRDKTGRIVGIIDPEGNETRWTFDAMGRLTTETDALGRRFRTGYDAAGNLTFMDLPNGASASLTRNALGLVSVIEDLNQAPWSLSYSPMGRLTGIEDPLERHWSVTYNDRGLVDQIGFPDGTSEERGYDATGRLILRHFSDGSELQFQRDALGRLEHTDGVTLSRNAAGQIESTADGMHAFGATYSPFGLLEAVSYANTMFQVIYGYDERNLLVTVFDDLTQTQIDLSYDDDGRLVHINRTNGVVTTRVYDQASRLTQIHHGEWVHLTLTYDANGNVQTTSLDGPLEPGDFLFSQEDAYTYDAAGQIQTPPYATDARGRLTSGPWGGMTTDIAGRLTAMGDVSVSTNGLGHLRTWHDAATQTQFFYNDVFDPPRVVAELDELTETFRRFYVWTPSGRLLYAIDADQGNAVRYYHFDHLGSTLCLTDESGALTRAFVYDPYGRILAESGSPDQPYTFLGAFGVRQMDPQGGLFATGDRLYDALTGRFTSLDHQWPRSDHPLLLNPYGYALNRPTTLVDPTGRQPVRPERPEQLVQRWVQGIVQFPEAGLERIVGATPRDVHGLGTLATDPRRTATFASASLPQNPSWKAQTAETGMFNAGMFGPGMSSDSGAQELAGLIFGTDFSPVKTLDAPLMATLAHDFAWSFRPPESPQPQRPPSRLIPEHWQPPLSMISPGFPTFDGRIHRPMEPDDLRPILHLGKTESVWKLFRKHAQQVQPKYPNTARTGWIDPANGLRPQR